MSFFLPWRCRKLSKRTPVPSPIYSSIPFLISYALFLIHCNRRRQEKGFHSPPVLPFLCFLSYKGEQEKRREREGEMSDKKNTILMGRAKKRMEERWIKERERQNKEQRRWHSSLSILFPLSLQGIEQTGSKETEWQNLSQSFIYLPCLSLILKSQSCYSQIGALLPLQEIAFPLFCVLKRLRKTTDKKRGQGMTK